MLPNIPFKAPHFHTLAQLTASVDSDSNVLIALWMFTTTDNVSPPTIQASDGNNGSPVSQLELTVLASVKGNSPETLILACTCLADCSESLISLCTDFAHEK